MENTLGFFISGFITIILWFPIALVLARKGHFTHKSEIIIAEAETAGRVAEATLIKRTRLRGDPGSPKTSRRLGGWKCVYQYTVNGKNYKWRCSTEDDPPLTLNLYYPENQPKKAIANGSYLPGGKVAGLTLLPLLIWFIIYKLFFV